MSRWEDLAILELNREEEHSHGQTEAGPAGASVIILKMFLEQEVDFG